MAPRTYLLEHACYKPPEELRCCVADMEREGKAWPMYSEEAKEFLYKIFVKSGISPNATYLPAAIHPCHTKEPKNDMTTAMLEAETVMGGALSELLDRTGLKATDIDILVTCCSIFTPTPSLASMLVNKFKMRTDIASYHLGGMGCGTGVVAINLCRDLLKAHPNSICVFVPCEVTTYCFYPGQDKTRWVANGIFRMGGAAVALTNKESLRHRAKYELMAAVRVHTGADDPAYKCMSWGPDQEGLNGVYLGKDVVQAAGKAITVAIKDIAPKIMTTRQYMDAIYNMAMTTLGYTTDVYQPDFTECCDHFCLHAGGYAVLKGVQKGLQLPSEKMIPSFAGLREYGNTSCSTTWYSLAYIESCGKGVAAGERVLQLGVGGGMKVGVNVWRALRPVHVRHSVWEHIADNPLTEADLPRGLEDGDIRDPRMAKMAQVHDEAAKRARAARMANGIGATPGQPREEVEVEH